MGAVRGLSLCIGKIGWLYFETRELPGQVKVFWKGCIFCILCKMQKKKKKCTTELTRKLLTWVKVFQNVHILTKMHAFYSKCNQILDFQWEVTFTFKILMKQSEVYYIVTMILSLFHFICKLFSFYPNLSEHVLCSSFYTRSYVIYSTWQMVLKERIYQVNSIVVFWKKDLTWS